MREAVVSPGGYTTILEIFAKHLDKAHAFILSSMLPTAPLHYLLTEKVEEPKEEI
ncbi:MAG: hypothetical protein ACPLSM_07425 [Thermosphaera sp.]